MGSSASARPSTSGRLAALDRRRSTRSVRPSRTDVERALGPVQLPLVQLPERRRLVGHRRDVEVAGRAARELEQDHRGVLGSLERRARPAAGPAARTRPKTAVTATTSPNSQLAMYDQWDPRSPEIPAPGLAQVEPPDVRPVAAVVGEVAHVQVVRPPDDPESTSSFVYRAYGMNEYVNGHMLTTPSRSAVSVISRAWRAGHAQRLLAQDVEAALERGHRVGWWWTLGARIMTASSPRRRASPSNES